MIRGECEVHFLIGTCYGDLLRCVRFDRVIVRLLLRLFVVIARKRQLLSIVKAESIRIVGECQRFFRILIALECIRVLLLIIVTLQEKPVRVPDTSLITACRDRRPSQEAPAAPAAPADGPPGR